MFQFLLFLPFYGPFLWGTYFFKTNLSHLGTILPHSRDLQTFQKAAPSDGFQHRSHLHAFQGDLQLLQRQAILIHDLRQALLDGGSFAELHTMQAKLLEVRKLTQDLQDLEIIP